LDYEEESVSAEEAKTLQTGEVDAEQKNEFSFWITAMLFYY
jgi:hypothetical protein